jgi:ATP-dependent RNA helicase DDX21
VGAAANLTTLTIYGGTPYAPQENILRRGVDIVVGTPGRVKDHLERGTLKLQQLKFRVLDECDEMLNMGFVDDVEKILKAVDDPAQVTTFLFSATMPPWVKDVQDRFLKQVRATLYFS